ncbi:aminoacyl-histidine dipeptidase [Litoribrevibacter albus]|uniref:Cytosol non-specific dipeptidase n=1 Tax=Litoribrevibacter albus TaxID=1473156 RepID=A0AA37W6V2_9GAMM|nr:aminoacyl-histidine dipeptidase [Litoribrevibacter albus]GLQ29861.1 aminoacyl-histidine dipeptidase [Litoribrevibacter albus]
MTLSQLQPSSLWTHFEKICSIPHPSKHEEELIAYIVSQAEAHGVQVDRDEVGNVKLTKSATPGYEQAVPVVMQSHIDMVPQKNAETEHNFETDPIKAYVDGNWVTAKGTTLGADNGIGVAAIMAVMCASDICHGPLEALLTVDEEAGMTGAFELKEAWFNSKVLLNLDTEEEGELYVGCAGGVDVTVNWPVSKEPVAADCIAFNLSVKGLKGGHSGIDIHKGRGNANKLLNRVLLTLSLELDITIAELNGGTLRNAIPREAFAKVVIPKDQEQAFQRLLADVVDDITDEYAYVESDLLIKAKASELPDEVMDSAAVTDLLRAILTCPNGVLRNSDRFDGVVETSSNLGIMSYDGNAVSLQFMTRSLKDRARDNAVQRIRSCFELIGAEITAFGAYPGWSPSDDPTLLNLMKSVYKDLFDQTPGTQIIHAGLECGILGAKYPAWDMISFGPTITGAHSPDEQVNIHSVQRFWTYLLAVLKRLAKMDRI